MFTLADGGISSIGALLPLLAVFFAVTLIVTAAPVTLACLWWRRRDRPFWLRDASVPRRLRLLAAVQVLGVVVYTLAALLALLAPGRSVWVWYVLPVRLVLAAALCVTVRGYARLDPATGLRGGRVLGVALLVHAAVMLLLPWPYGGVDGVALGLGAIILALLTGRAAACFTDPPASCPRCRYDLHAAEHALCPECGAGVAYARAA
jgi:hypothetical protein